MEKGFGLIHIYTGHGKGKTTCATGLSVRALGTGKKVLFTQFFKNGKSGEILSLEKLGADIMVSPSAGGRYSKLNDLQKEEAKEAYSELFDEVCEKAKGYDLLVLDEIISTVNYGVVSEDKLLDFLRNKPEDLEVVLTGRDPSDNLKAVADYVTSMEKIKHPYDQGISARKGIEF